MTRPPSTLQALSNLADAQAALSQAQIQASERDKRLDVSVHAPLACLLMLPAVRPERILGALRELASCPAKPSPAASLACCPDASQGLAPTAAWLMLPLLFLWLPSLPGVSVHCWGQCSDLTPRPPD